MNCSDAQPRDAAPTRSSIIAHPWFPKMIGLWFAALFGLCSLALAPEMLERIVTTLGIDRIVPAAAPPLGQTARLLLALGLAGVGEIAGLLLGARLAASRAPQQVRQRGTKAAASEADTIDDAPNLRDRDRHPDAPARKPLSATSDLGDDAGRELGGIDTALRRRALASEAAPMPEPQPKPISAVEAKLEAPSGSFVASFLAPPAPVVAPIAMSEPGSPWAARAPIVEIATTSLDALGVVQLSERLALALQARRERRTLVAVAVPVAIEAVEEPPVAEATVAPAEPVAPMQPPASFAFAPLAEDVADGDGDDSPEELTDNVLEEGYSSLLAMGSGSHRPEAVRIGQPVSDEIEPVVIFPGQGARFAAEPVQPPPDSSADGPIARPGMAAAASNAPASAEPASQVDPEVTDRALRAALASLQRISGAR